ncbi:MAG: hypothetical protein VYC39_08385 [Myxococcota bacterium]|nr:hypothetical protein [Myxococcota bacterium]
MWVSSSRAIRLLLAVSWFFCVLAISQVSHARESRLSMYFLSEAWGETTAPGHVAVMARWDRRLGNNQAKLTFEFNTETINLELDQVYLASRMSLGGQIRAEALGTNVLFDYFQNGEYDASRTIAASNGLANVWVNWNPFSRFYVRHEHGLRKWLSIRVPGRTSPSLELPEDSFVYESRLNLTWWNLDNDVAWSQRQRNYPRLQGFAVGTTFGANWQFDTRPWGARDALIFTPVDSRNQPEHFQWSITQWFLGGWKIADGVRLQIKEEAGWAAGVDDLSRRTVGGLTPFTVNLPGMPWAYTHADKHASTMASFHFKLPVADVEVGPLVSGIVVQDFERIGASQFTSLWGFGGFVDYRFGPWQFDIRGGYSPALRAHHPEQGAWSVLGVIGWGSIL